MFSINLPADRAGELLKTLKSAKSRVVSNFKNKEVLGLNFFFGDSNWDRLRIFR